MKLIPLTQGKFAQVDDQDFEWLNQWKWCASKDGQTFYAVRHEYYSVDPLLKRQIWKSRSINMHRLILGIHGTKQLGDHKDGDGLNNQRENLRIATSQQNNMNKKGRGASKYLGVSEQAKNTSYTRWRAAIKNKDTGKYIHLGNFPHTPDGEILAAKAYDSAAQQYHGEFANLNFKTY